MILEDFIMLGKTVPEANADGRQFVCTAGYSLELRQPIRIYPMARLGSPPRWSVSRIPIERNVKDSRPESWKIRGDRTPDAHAAINRVIQRVQDRTPPELQRKILAALTVTSLKEANARRLSLCVLMPTAVPQLRMERGETAEMAPTPDMFATFDARPVAQRFRWHPRLKFVDEGGKHDLMLRDWGCYERMRKRGDERDSDLAMHLDECLNLSTAPPLLCGNLNQFRNSWLVISVFSGTVHARPEIFDGQLSLFEKTSA